MDFNGPCPHENGQRHRHNVPKKYKRNVLGANILDIKYKIYF